MAAPTLWLGAVLLLASLAHPGEGLRCWVCSSDVDHKCGDPFNTTQQRFLLNDCDRDRSHTTYLQSPAVCRKFKHVVNGETIVVRSCAFGHESAMDGPCSPSALHFTSKLEHCSVCTHDECNSATSATLSLLVVLPAALLLSSYLP